MKKKQTEDISFILNSYKLTKDSLLKWLNDLSSKQGNTVFCDPEENSVSTLKTEIKNLNKGPQDFNSGKYKNKANSLSNKVYKLCFMYESMDKMLPHSDNFLVSVETDKTLNSLCAFNSVLLAACKNSQDSSSSQPKASPPILDVSPKKNKRASNPQAATTSSNPKSKIIKSEELHKAVVANDIEKLKQLITPDNVDQMDSYGLTPLYLAVQINNVEAIKVLMNSGADPNQLNLEGYRMIDKAAFHGNIDFLKELNALGVDITKKNNVLQTTCGHIATQQDNIELLKFLQEVGFDFYSTNENKHTCLEMAMYKENTDVLCCFKELGLDLNRLNSEGDALAHTAVKLHKITALKCLLKLEIDINQQNSEGFSCVHLAVLRRCYPSLTQLKKAGADFAIPIKQGIEPSQLYYVTIAIGLDDVKLLQYLENFDFSKNTEVCITVAVEYSSTNILRFFAENSEMMKQTLVVALEKENSKVLSFLYNDLDIFSVWPQMEASSSV